MERKDVMEKNVGIFAAQGKALAGAKPSVKCLVVGNPANTNAAILSLNAPAVPRSNISALTRLDHNRARVSCVHSLAAPGAAAARAPPHPAPGPTLPFAPVYLRAHLRAHAGPADSYPSRMHHLHPPHPNPSALAMRYPQSMLAIKSGLTVTDVDGVIIWGNHSSTQYPDVRHATVGGKQALSKLPQDWLEGEFLTSVQKRGAAVIAARKLSSAASAAKVRPPTPAAAAACGCRALRLVLRPCYDPAASAAPPPRRRTPPPGTADFSPHSVPGDLRPPARLGVWHRRQVCLDGSRLDRQLLRRPRRCAWTLGARVAGRPEGCNRCRSPLPSPQLAALAAAERPLRLEPSQASSTPSL